MALQQHANVALDMRETSSRAAAWHDDHSDRDGRDELTTDCVLVEHEVRRSAFGERGVYATEHIPAGTPAVVFGGFVTPGPRFRALSDHRQRHSFQIGEDLFMVCGETLNDGDLVNHSCEPSLGLTSEITLVAIHDIVPGEELTFDYATCDSTPYDEFECECGTPTCRGKVTGEDWMSPEVQQLRAGYFSPYLARRIANITA